MIYLPWTHKPPYGVKLNTKHPLAQGLVGCWLMNEGGGDIVYDLATNNHLDFVDSPSWSIDGIDFDGGTAHLKSRRVIGVLPETTMLISIKPEETADGGWLCIGTSSNNSDLYTGIRRDYNTGARGCYNPGSGDCLIVNNTSGGMPANEKNDIALIKAAGVNPELYINGISATSTQSTDATQAGDGLLYVGSGVKGAANCFIYFVMIWDKALSPSELISLYANPYQIFEPMFIPSYVAAAGGSVLPTDVSATTSVGTVSIIPIRLLSPSDVECVSEISDVVIAGLVNTIQGVDVSSDSLITQASVQAIRKLIGQEISSLTQITNVSIQVARHLGLTDVEAQTEVASVVLSVVRRLAGSNLSVDSEIIDVALNVVHHVGINNLETVSEITGAVLTITGGIVGIDVQSQADITDIVLSVIRAIKQNNIESGSTVEAATLQAIRKLSFSNVSSDSQVETVVVTTSTALGITDVDSLSSITNAVMAVIRMMAPINISIESEVSSPAISVLRQIFSTVIEAETSITTAGLSVVGIAVVGKVHIVFSMATPGAGFTITKPDAGFEVE